MKNKDSYITEQTIITLPEYGIQKIKHCADSYRNIAKIFLNFQGASEQSKAQNRQGMIFQRQMMENQYFMAEQFLNMADKLSQVATESYQFVPEEEKQFKQLARYLKREGVEIKHIYFMENENRDGVLEITMRVAQNKERIPVTDIAEALGLYYDMRLKPSIKSGYFVEPEYQSFTFIQEPAFMVLSGQAMAIKDGEEISGDSILVSEAVDGHMYFLMADGVGSGREASLRSEKVLDFMEKFLAAGYSKEHAIQILNGLILQDGQESAMSTLDVCDMNLYKGVCEFSKIGAAASYHKRDYLVEKIWIENLPLGAFGTMDLDVARRRLDEGDYIIMLTDGILESLITLGQEEKLVEYISKLSVKNPREMAQKILQYCIGICRGNIRDDMSVLVFGMWKN
ncbi:MAG: SpoIIE family protein phosphatase [Lachnospiraceae bacterium]|nr:SpoIIE family protein phosphatase [Lachnospiraceae bacterium]MBR4059235.1 SpoIIE family protein phosphatase [Lachnospiraceae bacterium]